MLAGQKFDCLAVRVSEVQGSSKPKVSKQNQSQVLKYAAAKAKGRSIAQGFVGFARQKMVAYAVVVLDRLRPLQYH